MIQITDILQCPACKGRIDEGLQCQQCRAKYEARDGIPVIVHPKVSRYKSSWDSVDFSTGRIMSKLDLYHRFLNQETKEAQALWRKAMIGRIGTFNGVVADVASGLGAVMADLVSSKASFSTVATDIDPMVLGWNRSRTRVPQGREIYCVASDAQHFAFQDRTFDGITNADGLINICCTSEFLSEMHRTLKPGGRLVIMHRLFPPQSRSFGLAKVYGIDKNLEPGPLEKQFREAGFSRTTIDVVSSAVWADNPGQHFPLAGDLQSFAIVEAVK